MKLKVHSSKPKEITKRQIQNVCEQGPALELELVFWGFSGAWSWELGAFGPHVRRI
jgi:hypothetical protein